MKVKTQKLGFFQKMFLSLKKRIDQSFFSGVVSQLVTLSLLFILLLAAGSYTFEQIKGKDIITESEDAYFERGMIWSLIHATDPGYLSGDYDSSKLQIFWLGLIVTLAGWFILSGFIMTIFINYYQSHLDRIQTGLSRYYFWGRHRMILGWSMMGASVVEQLFTENSKPVIILSLLSPAEIRKELELLIATCECKIRKKRIYIYQGSYDAAGELKYFNYKKTEKAVILGDFEETNQNVKNIQAIIKINDMAELDKSNKRITCYVHLSDFRTYDLLQDVDLEELEKIDFRPFNFYEDWARRLWSILPEVKSSELEMREKQFDYSPLCYRTITPASTENVHLVVIGFGQMGQALAAQAARICHYANGKKTRITVFDETGKGENIFRSHCNVRTIPDIELNVINQAAEAEDTRKFLRGLAADENQITSIAVCISNPDTAISVALSLPQEILLADIPLLIWQETRSGLSDLAAKLMKNPKWKDIRFFGMLHECFGLDNRLDILAREIHENYRKAAGIEYVKAWEEIDERNKWANRYQADSYAELLSSAGYHFEPAIGEDNMLAADDNLEWFAEREHDRWSAEKFIAGWRQADFSSCKSKMERKTKRDNFRLIHINLAPFAELDDIQDGSKQKDRDVILNICTLLKAEGINLQIRKEGKNG